MATEEQIQDPATFGEVSVSVTEEKEFPLDPSLLALSGNDMQQYCTMLSLLGTEFQNIKPLMFFKTEQGEMPLSLVTVVEDFEVGPGSHEGNESVPFDLPQQGSPGPLVQIQYNFVLDSEGGILPETPSGCWPEHGADLQASKNEPVASGESLCVLPQRLMGNSNAHFPQPGGFWQPNEIDWTARQGNQGPVSEQSNTQNINGLNLLLENDPRPGGDCGDPGVGEISIHQITPEGEISPFCDSSRESTNRPPSSASLEGSHAGETVCSCPNCGRVLNIKGNPATHQSPPTRGTLCTCPSCGYLFCYYTQDSAEEPQVTLTDDWEGLFHQMNLNRRPRLKADRLQKCFHCPDCGRGFVHKSSIPRHQKLHRKENLSQPPGPEKSHSPTRNRLGNPKAQPRKNGLSCPDGGSRSAGQKKAPFAALCEVCGESFSLAAKFQRHLATHAQEKVFSCCHCGKAFGVKSLLVQHLLLHQPEKPFQCCYCEKSYFQKGHLNRHYQASHMG